MSQQASLLDLPRIGADDIDGAVSVVGAISALERALLNGCDPARDPARITVATANGHLLLMPSELGDFLGVKIASVLTERSPEGPPRINACYLLLDSQTLTPVALLDGNALTSLRTAAVSALVAKRLATESAKNLLVFGAGPQARAHLKAMRFIRPLEQISAVVRSERAAGSIDEFASGLGLEIQTIDLQEVNQVNQAVAESDLIVCATTATTPLFDGRLVSTSACVIAVGAHEPTAREIDGELVGRSLVVVEDRATAIRESGDIALAIAEGFLEPASLVTIFDLVNQHKVLEVMGRTTLFKSSGMAWEDLALAAEVYRRCIT
ncbi:MAG TPA: ornithine cyclodeaminase family protein [Candidatus Nanopelagicaceae bacterium]|nr:ornithine cyclodeaminase family protein [Candidatus Nanopelagicaceae bacterium]